MPDATNGPSLLTPAQAAEFAARGFAIVPDVLSAQECATVIGAAHDLEGPKGGSFKPVMQPHRQNPVFLQTLAHARLVNIIAQLVGGAPAGLQSEMFFCCPGTRGFTAHQDNFFVRGERNKFVSAWIPLVDVTSQKGSLFVYPGSHEMGLLPVRETHLAATAHQDVDGYSRETVFPDNYVPTVEHLSAPAGAAVLLNGDLVHGSNANTSDKFRYVLLCTYIRAGSSFNPGRHAKRSEIPLRQIP